MDGDNGNDLERSKGKGEQLCRRFVLADGRWEAENIVWQEADLYFRVSAFESFFTFCLSTSITNNVSISSSMTQGFKYLSHRRTHDSYTDGYRAYLPGLKDLR
jgi:hypothetical protein